MRPSEIAALFVGDNANKEAEEYLKSEGCPSFLYSQEGKKHGDLCLMLRI